MLGWSKNGVKIGYPYIYKQHFVIALIRLQETVKWLRLDFVVAKITKFGI